MDISQQRLNCRIREQIGDILCPQIVEVAQNFPQERGEPGLRVMKEIVEGVRQERCRQCVVEQIVDMAVPEQIRDIPLERTGELFDDVLYPQVTEGTVGVVRLIPQERISERIGEQTVCV